MMTGRWFSTMTAVYWWQVSGLPRWHRFTDDRLLVYRDDIGLLMTGRWFSTMTSVYWWQVVNGTYAWRGRILVLIIIQS